MKSTSLSKHPRKVKPEYTTDHTIIQEDTTGLKPAYTIDCHAWLAMIKTRISRLFECIDNEEEPIRS